MAWSFAFEILTCEDFFHVALFAFHSVKHFSTSDWRKQPWLNKKANIDGKLSCRKKIGKEKIRKKHAKWSHSRHFIASLSLDRFSTLIGPCPYNPFGMIEILTKRSSLLNWRSWVLILILTGRAAGKCHDPFFVFHSFKENSCDEHSVELIWMKRWWALFHVKNYNRITVDDNHFLLRGRQFYNQNDAVTIIIDHERPIFIYWHYCSLAGDKQELS